MKLDVVPSLELIISQLEAIKDQLNDSDMVTGSVRSLIGMAVVALNRAKSNLERKSAHY